MAVDTDARRTNVNDQRRQRGTRVCVRARAREIAFNLPFIVAHCPPSQQQQQQGANETVSSDILRRRAQQ